MCPMKFTIDELAEDTIKCDQHLCAWWDPGEEQCAVLVIGTNVYQMMAGQEQDRASRP
jgi:hypothetical protein